MANTTFVNGTVIEAEWLNEVNDFVFQNYGTIYNVKDSVYGAVGNNTIDDTIAIQAAVNAAAASGSYVVYFPPGTYKISAAITTTVPIMFFGNSSRTTIIRQDTATANGIEWNLPTPAAGNGRLRAGGGLMGITLEAGAGYLCAAATGTGSSGIGLRLENSNGQFVASDFAVHNFDNPIQTIGSFYPTFTNFDILYFAGSSFTINKNDSGAVANNAGGFYYSGKISNLGFTGTNTVSRGFNILATGGEFISDIDITSVGNPVVVQPGAGSQCAYLFFTNVLADSAIYDGWVFDATNGPIISVECTQCWSGFNGLAGLKTKGALLDSVRWNGGRLRENGHQGWIHEGGSNVVVSNAEIAQNSQLTTNIYDGVLIGANVSDWALLMCRVGNFASGSSNDQANGITISSGTSQRFRIIGNDFTGFGSGKTAVANGSSTLNWVISNNLPLQALGNNPSSSINFSTSTTSTIAAGATTYLGPAGQNATIDGAFFVSDRNGVVSKFIASSTAAPGAGETFTYTLMVNGVATSMAGTISGAASFSATVTTNPATISVNDTITLRLVSSASAAVTYHRCTITLEP